MPNHQRPSAFTPIELPAMRERGFTLIELLVVVAIIVVLLALLMPALDKAIYQAELSVCGANLKGVGTGSVTYAAENGRRYPYREAVYDQGIPNYQPRHLTAPFGLLGQDQKVEGYDDRPVLRKAFSVNALNCPLTDDIDLDGATPNESIVVSGYTLWVGWKYNKAHNGDNNNSGAGGMLKLGQRINFNGKAYDTLAGDVVIGFNFNINSSHPDDKGVLALRTFEPTTAPPPANGQEPQQFTLSEYFGSMWNGPGLYDLNFVRDDLSVTRIDKTDWGNGETWAGTDIEPRMDVLPMNKDADNNWGQISVPRGR